MKVRPLIEEAGHCFHPGDCLPPCEQNLGTRAGRQNGLADEKASERAKEAKGLSL